ncbi:MAG: hypothetical protein K0R38_5008 [Polyangiaceae bacterium]|nr:hypothetical protein [Polyangiaceae bacterium]
MGFMTSLERASRLFAVLSVCVFVGCAASPKAEPPATPGAVPAAPAATFASEPEPQTLAEAEALLEKSRAELDRLALSSEADAEATSGAAAPAPAPAPASAPARAESREERADAQPQAKAESPCQSACRAFSSLSRASEAVCRLEADGGKRCERARQIRDDASQRVAGCGCLR